MRIRETAAKEDNDIVASMTAALLHLRTPTKPGTRVFSAF